MVLKPRLKKSGNGLKAAWYVVPGVYDATIDEMLSHVDLGGSLDFKLNYNGKYRDRFFPERLLFNLVEQFGYKRESSSTMNLGLTKRILDSGGYLSYIRKLESMLDEQSKKI